MRSESSNDKECMYQLAKKQNVNEWVRGCRSKEKKSEPSGSNHEKCNDRRNQVRRIKPKPARISVISHQAPSNLLDATLLVDARVLFRSFSIFWFDVWENLDVREVGDGIGLVHKRSQFTSQGLEDAKDFVEGFVVAS